MLLIICASKHTETLSSAFIYLYIWYIILGNGEFIEHAVFAGNMYGTSKAAVETVKSKGEVFAIKNVSNYKILI